MLQTDARFSAAVSAVVAEVERATSAEIVVVAAARSASYAAFSALGGAALAWLGLAFVLWSPLDFSGLWLPLELPVLGLGGAWLFHHSPALLHRLIPPALQQAAVRRAAHGAFHEESVHGTRARTGVLVYLSALEDRVCIVADGGVESRLPPGRLATVRWGAGAVPTQPGDLDHFLGGLRSLGGMLAEVLPADPDDNPDELPDAPRIRS